MKRTIIAALAALLLVGVGIGCQSDEGAKNGDDKAEAQQASEKDDEEEGDEHPGEDAEEGEEGEEHPGDEHPGEDHEEGEEHPGDEHPGDGAKKEKKKEYGSADIKKAMKAHIEGESDDNGIFTIEDSENDETLKLKFVKIHDPVRKMEGKGYFGCTDFHAKGKKKKVYDLDFWLNPKDGELKVTKSKIHKDAVKKDGEWTKEARYTFKDDEVVALD